MQVVHVMQTVAWQHVYVQVVQNMDWQDVDVQALMVCRPSGLGRAGPDSVQTSGSGVAGLSVPGPHSTTTSG